MNNRTATLMMAAVMAAVPALAQQQKKAAAPAKPAAVAKPAAKPTGKTAFDKATMEAYVRHLGVWGPQIKVEISDPVASPQLPGFQEVKVRASLGENFNEEIFLVSKDGKKILRPPVYDIESNPFKPELDKIKTEFQPSFGTPGAPVVIVVFSDYQCPFCKEEAKVIRKELAKAYPTQVRVYFRDFPLEAIHNWSRPAARAGRCVYRVNPAAFWDYHDWMFENQASMTPESLSVKVLEWGKTKNLDLIALGRCIDNKDTEAEVEKSLADGRALGVDRTPYLFINGRRVPGTTWQSLKQIIDFEIDYQKTAQNAGEAACCTLSLPSPLTPAK